MKRYTKAQFSELRQRPAPGFVHTMEIVLSNLPDQHAALRPDAGLYYKTFSFFSQHFIYAMSINIEY